MTAGLFDGIVYPRITVFAAVGVGADPNQIILDTGPVLDTGTLGGIDMAEITKNSAGVYCLRSYERSSFGRPTPIDPADPATATLVFNNSSGDYDPTNPVAAWTLNRLTANQQGLEGAVTTGWQVGGNCTITTTTTQKRTGNRSLQLTSSASGNLWANTTTGTGGVRVTAGEQYRVSAWLRSAASARSATVCVMYWDQNGNFFDQDNAPNITTSTSAWTQAAITVQVPVGAFYASAQVLFLSAAAASEVHYADDIMVQSSALTITTPIQVVAEWPLGLYWPRITGEIRKISLDAGLDPTVTITVADGLEKLGRTQLPTEAPEFADNTSGQRVNNVLDRAGWSTTARTIQDGYSTLHSTTLGTTALEELRQVEATETGLLFVKEAGNVTFYDRHRTSTASRSATVQISLADTGAAGEVGMVDLIWNRDTDRVYNDIRLTRDPDPAQDPELTGSEPGDVPVEQAASDQASIDLYGNLNLPATLGKLHASDTGVLAQAQGLITRYSLATDQIEEVTVNGVHPKISAENLWPKLLALTLLDRISASRDYGPNTIAGELHIQQLAEQVNPDPPGWEFRLTTAPPPPPSTFFYLDTDVLDTDMLGW